MKHLIRVGFVLLAAAVFSVVVPAGAQTVYEGNPTCADLGLSGDGYVELKDDPPTLHNVQLGGIVSVSYNDTRTVSGVLSLDVHEWGIAAVIVKGGDSANVWTFPDGTVSVAGPMTAPATGGGQLPDISHVTVCMCEKETTDTPGPPKETTTTTEVPPSEPTTTTSTSSVPSTTSTTPSSTSTTLRSTTTTEPTTSTTGLPPRTTPPTVTSSPPTTTGPPSTEITTNRDRLPETGVPSYVVAGVGVMLVASGALIRRLATD